MTATLEKKEETMSVFEERNIQPSNYSCQVIQERTTHENANDKSLPRDAYLVTYIEKGVEYLDVVRCRKTVELFDMYYDVYGPGAVQKIDFGYGTISPKLWGYKSKNKDDKKK